MKKTSSNGKKKESHLSSKEVLRKKNSSGNLLGDLLRNGFAKKNPGKKSKKILKQNPEKAEKTSDSVIKQKNSTKTVLNKLPMKKKGVSKKNQTILTGNVIKISSLPIIFLYYEILFMIFRHSNISLLYPIMFAIGIGSILSFFLGLLPKKPYRIIKGVLIGIVALMFIVETLVRSSFQQYMTLEAILYGTGGVVGHYTKLLIWAILGGIPVILMFGLPVVGYILFHRFCDLPVKKNWFFLSLNAEIGVVMMVLGLFFVGLGAKAETWSSNYSFNIALENFGLLAGTGLEMKYSLLGNSKKDSFDLEDTTRLEILNNEDGLETESEGFDLEAFEEEAHKETEQTKIYLTPDDFGYNVMDLDFDALKASAPDNTIAEMYQYVETVVPSMKNEYTGVFAGKNLIMICAEALSDCAVSPELTPTLYRVMNNGFRFHDFYQPSWGGSTSTGEFSFVFGLTPIRTDKTMIATADDNNYFTMGNSLQRLGYTSYAYHAGSYDFYHRDQTHENLGYSRYLATGNGLEDIVGGEYVDDITLFDKTMGMYTGSQPFSIYYMTYSGHSDYEKNRYVDTYLDIVDTYFGNRYKDITKYYLCYQMVFDRALELMINRLEELGIADDTVIVICPDHYPYGLEEAATYGTKQDYLSDLYGYKYTNWWNLDHSCAAIWSACMEKDPSEPGYVAPADITGVSSSIDITPTLLNLFGIEYDSRLLAGHDLLAPNKEALVVWENYSWLTDVVYHDSRSGVNYLTDGSGRTAGPEYDEYIYRISKTAKNMLLYSDRVIGNNFFGVMFGVDDIT